MKFSAKINKIQHTKIHYDEKGLRSERKYILITTIRVDLVFVQNYSVAYIHTYKHPSSAQSKSDINDKLLILPTEEEKTTEIILFFAIAMRCFCFGLQQFMFAKFAIM